MDLLENIDIVVVGAGHAGCEAAVAAARLGSKVVLITLDLTNPARLSCNPSIGGIAKGQIVKEIDALGGYTGIVADKSMIQFRMLNRSKGPAMWSPRSQNDRWLYSYYWREILENTSNLFLWKDEVIDIEPLNNYFIIKTKMGVDFKAKAAIITAGTFLNGKIFIGQVQITGGRLGEPAAHGLTESLKKLNIESDRLKTGTPVRIDGRTIDFSKMIEQPGDDNPSKFSYSDDTKPLEKQRNCWITYTNEQTHEILKKGFHLSPLFTGIIKGIGPRYCPSIEDKIVRFSGKNSHQLFVEPDGWHTYEYYLNGFSSSLPLDIQIEALHSINGLENSHIIQPGYAIEYDYFPPYQLNNTLESKKIEKLFFAGQVNGTTGYEEAAAQGLIAGINAHLKINNQQSLILSRSQAYIGVLIDDLISKTLDEPYRMFTSRAEHRLILRQDNADIRLSPIAHEIGLINDDRYNKLLEKLDFIKNVSEYLNKNSIEPDKINNYLSSITSSPIKQKIKWTQLIMRPEISILDLSKNFEVINNLIKDKPSHFIETLEIEIKYAEYIKKENELAEKLIKFDQMRLPQDFDYQNIKNISIEARQKLIKIKPANIGIASRITGISPADIAVLINFFYKKNQ
ncbi:MAG TPA: tRNA uridine-5-carboxymethylaminomethyl(34) synthesis enzyme MnmG [Bacteroidales bacterium]|nr:tRNA uridine-5-carboxymethylaminomethyl(34) synthesis enzyme MnmG [Bacteroidales bacterium]HPL02878.1 tRNA uridine-5-carboxymethylaminomethyl(34) synthesis enzyme MnmG [Bacteroidales bacterium]HQE78451.1 tRNA uridine-5-carboxymethylaminomethyl(34) synthesis enzyme MnmG [Bacteroidales bacterium]